MGFRVLRYIAIGGWSAVFAGWLVGLWLDRTAVRERVDNRWRCRIYGITAATVLLAIVVDRKGARHRRPLGMTLATLPVFAGGMALYYWARLGLGRNWSSEARIAEGHHLVTDGAYGLVRHPIYLSKVLMAFSAGIMLGNPWVMGLAVVLAGAAVYQAYVEERMLGRHFPTEHHLYTLRTGMLAPKRLGRFAREVGKVRSVASFADRRDRDARQLPGNDELQADPSSPFVPRVPHRD